MKGLGETEDSSCSWEAPLGSSCEVRARQVQLVWVLWDGCGQRLQVRNLGPRPRKKSQGWDTFQPGPTGPSAGLLPLGRDSAWSRRPAASKPRSGRTLMGLFSIHPDVLLMGPFVGLRLERKLHSPDSLAAKVLDLISNSPNRIPHGDLDLGAELSGRRQASGHPLAGKRSRGSTILQSAASRGSGFLHTGAAFLVRRDTMNLAAGSCSWKFSQVSAPSAPPLVL